MVNRKRSLVGERFDYLKVVSLSPSRKLYGELHRHWECRCDCGGSIIVNTLKLTSGAVFHCDDCDPERGGRVYLDHYQAFREHFTPEQRQRYEQILRGRRGRWVESEAVDVTLRELPATMAVHEAVLGKGCVPASVLHKLVEAASREVGNGEERR